MPQRGWLGFGLGVRAGPGCSQPVQEGYILQLWLGTAQEEPNGYHYMWHHPVLHPFGGGIPMSCKKFSSKNMVDLKNTPWCRALDCKGMADATGLESVKAVPTASIASLQAVSGSTKDQGHINPFFNVLSLWFWRHSLQIKVPQPAILQHTKLPAIAAEMTLYLQSLIGHNTTEVDITINLKDQTAQDQTLATLELLASEFLEGHLTHDCERGDIFHESENPPDSRSLPADVLMEFLLNPLHKALVANGRWFQTWMTRLDPHIIHPETIFWTQLSPQLDIREEIGYLCAGSPTNSIATAATMHTILCVPMVSLPLGQERMEGSGFGPDVLFQVTTDPASQSLLWYILVKAAGSASGQRASDT
ncbi:hypothetical protein C8J57DRAFT_1259103 [Mycena rebaudengoi]|nr:hypothetical protein C8J57DRAFT_1259103 [Mycena rebaudengoi]